MQPLSLDLQHAKLVRAVVSLSRVDHLQLNECSENIHESESPLSENCATVHTVSELRGDSEQFLLMLLPAAVEDMQDVRVDEVSK